MIPTEGAAEAPAPAPMPPPPLPPATGALKAAWILMAGTLLFLFHYRLIGGLVAGLVAYTLLHKATSVLHTPRVSRGAAKLLSLALLGLVAAGATTGLVLLLIGFVRGGIGDLPALFQKMADIVDQARTQLLDFGIRAPFLDDLLGDGKIQEAASEWLRAHSTELGHLGGALGHFLLHALMGMVVGLLVFFHHPEAHDPAPLAAALFERIRRFALAFERVVVAQLEISAVNAVFTGIYLFVLLPLLGTPLPLSGTLLAVTFLAGLIPVVGNLLSNTAIVGISLGVSLPVALLSLTFLVAIHKLEYFLNAKIVGARIGAAAWETLLAIIVMEAAFGLAGVVLAPIVYAYVKGELSDRRLV
ncbi:MAG TPA: AI-2E family transporter [Vicinamibacteria bacterium]